jgi:hypothetical protein
MIGNLNTPSRILGSWQRGLLRGPAKTVSVLEHVTMVRIHHCPLKKFEFLLEVSFNRCIIDSG